MLWYLVIPPFIVVLSLGALLWVFARSVGSEEVSRNLSVAQAEAMSGSRSRALSRKAFFLKLAEKTASRFKTSTLRIHNFFQDMLEKLRRRRSQLDEIRKHASAEEEEKAAADKVEEETVEKPRKRFGGFGKRNRKEERSGSDGEEAAEPDSFSGKGERRSDADEAASPKRSGVFGRRAGSFRDEAVREESVAEPKPMLRREVVRPEGGPVRTEKDPHEVELLSRIVENPRDIAAYEELGDWYFAAGSMEDAKECYRQALKLHPTNRTVKLKIRKLERFFEKRNG